MKKKDEYQVYYRLIEYVKEKIALFILCTVVSGVSVFLIFSLTGVLLKEIVAMVSNQIKEFSPILPFYIGGIVVLGILSGFAQTGFIYIEQILKVRLRETMLLKFTEMDESLSKKYMANEVLNRMMMDVEDSAKLVGYVISAWVFQPILSGICSIFLLLFVDVRVALLCILCALCNILFMKFGLEKIKNYKKNIVTTQSKISNFMQQCVNGILEIQTFQLHKVFQRKLQKECTYVEKNIQQMKRIQGIRIEINNFINGCVTSLGLLVLGGILSSYHIISFSSIMLALPLADQICQMFMAFSNFNLLVSRSIPSMERVFEIIDLPREVEVEYSNEKQGSKEIIFEQVSFAYEDKQVLYDINFSIKEGEKVAFIGESGSGKSTIIKLLLGLYMPKNGNIYSNGYEIHTCKKKEWRNQFSYVAQDSSTFHLSILENITMGTSMDKERVDTVVKEANAYDFIMKNKEKYNFILGEGSSGVSGGQLQRIALSRALYKNAPVLVMDEPTSALDKEAEQYIKNTIDQLKQTIITVTHRLELTKDFDIIYVLQKGKIQEKGSHMELLNQKGYYYQLWNSQIGG